MSEKRLLIIGAGGHGAVVAEAALAMNFWTEIHFLDNQKDLNKVIGIQVVGDMSDYESFKKTHSCAFVAIGNNKLRIQLIQMLENAGFNIPNIIHPRAFVSRYTNLSNGIAVLPGAIVNTNTCIGKGCIININAIVDHDCIIENGVHISSSAIIRSMVKIGEYSLISAGACIRSFEEIPANYSLEELELYRNE